jgi:hypothetical protein
MKLNIDPGLREQLCNPGHEWTVNSLAKMISTLAATASKGEPPELATVNAMPFAELSEAYFSTQDRKSALQAKHKVAESQLDSVLTAIEQRLCTNMTELGLKSAKVEGRGTLTVNMTTRYNVIDWDDYDKYVVETGTPPSMWFEKRPSQTAVADAVSKGHLETCVTPFTKQSISLRRS